MPEKIEFSEQERILMDQSDEDAMRYAFGEFIIKCLTMEDGSHRYSDFWPQSIKDYQVADAAKRQEALDYCLETARSERFSEERDQELMHLCAFLEKLTPEEFRCCYKLNYLGVLRDAPAFFQAHQLRECRERGDLPSDEKAQHLVRTLLAVIRRERSLQAGYLGLVQRLLHLKEVT